MSTRPLLYAATLLATLTLSAAGQPPPPPDPPTPAQKEKLQERDRFSKESDELEKAGKLREAVATAEKMLAIEREVFEKPHPDIAGSFTRIRRLKVRLEDWDGARAAGRETLKLRTVMHGADNWRTTDARLALADVDFIEKLPAEARASVRKAAVFVEDANRLYREGKYADAEPLYRESLAGRRKALGDAHPSTLTGVNNLAELYRAQGRYADAEPLYKEALGGNRKALGDAHPSTMMSMSNLAGLYRAQGRFADAEPLYKEALAGRRKALGDAHPDTLTGMGNLAGLYRAQGRYADAEPLQKEALGGHRKALGDAHRSTLTSMGNLAGLYHAQGRYADAEPLYREALASHRKTLGDAHPDTLTSVNNLAGLYRAQGRYADAEPLYREALAGCRKALGDAHPETLTSANNLAGLYRVQGRFADAEQLYREALAGRRKAHGDAHPSTLTVMGNLAELYGAQGRYADAEPLYREALGGNRKALGDAHPSTLTGVNNLAELYRAQGRYADAEPLYREALAGRRKTLGDAHPSTMMSMGNLAGLYRAQGRHADAEPLYKEALAGTRAHLERTAVGQSEGQQLAYRATLRHRLDYFVSVGTTAGTPAGDRYAEVLAWKGAAFTRRSRLRAAVGRTADSELEEVFAEAEAVARRLATLSTSTPAADQLAAYRKTMKELTARKDDLDQELGRKSEPFRLNREAAALTPDQLAKALPAGVAVVDYLEYRHATPDPEKKGRFKFEARFLAYVVRTGQPAVEVELGPAKPIADAVDAWRLTLGRGKPVTGPTDPAVVLRDAVWAAVAKHLGDAKVVLVSPDGALARLPFAALPGADPAKYLVEEVSLAVAPVPQLLPELLARTAAPAGDPSLLLVGDVDYDAAGGAPAAGTTARTADRTGDARAWQRLDATRDEVVAIRDSFEDRFPDAKVTLLRKAGATEAAVRRQAAGSRYVHVATHGFFAAPKPPAATPPGGRGFDDDFGAARSALAAAHPGLQSGLVFAGANQPPRPGADDGILTALEVAELDLSGVELAVLSACETKLGKEVSAEGTLGLERAFRVAGARSVVASLWKVPDRQTQQLMSRFYRNLWEKKLTRLEALRDAQLWMLREGKRAAEADPDAPAAADGGRLPPYFWAAFALSGDWR